MSFACQSLSERGALHSLFLPAAKLTLNRIRDEEITERLSRLSKVTTLVIQKYISQDPNSLFFFHFKKLIHFEKIFFGLTISWTTSNSVSKRLFVTWDFQVNSVTLTITSHFPTHIALIWIWADWIQFSNAYWRIILIILEDHNAIFLPLTLVAELDP